MIPVRKKMQPSSVRFDPRHSSTRWPQPQRVRRIRGLAGASILPLSQNGSVVEQEQFDEIVAGVHELEGACFPKVGLRANFLQPDAAKQVLAIAVVSVDC